MANKYYTLLIVPEKTQEVKRLIIPAWVAKSIGLTLFFALLLATIMLIDYWHVMNQIGENKDLKTENRRLRQQVQVYKNKVTTIEDTLDRIKTFATRLKVITNIEDRSNVIKNLNSGKLPDAASNLPDEKGASQATPQDPTPSSARDANYAQQSKEPTFQQNASAALSAVLGGNTDSLMSDESPEDQQLHKDQEELDHHFTELHHDSLNVEQILQDEYELLADQKAFLAALPTRKPAVGYFTNGFGIRRSPFGGAVKMHEGVDIANYPGTLIRATADGMISFSGVKAGYGQTIIIDHGYGLETWYTHNKVNKVSKGQRVRRGDNIALLGASGRATGPHVHYEVRVNGWPVNPLSYILEN